MDVWVPTDSSRKAGSNDNTTRATSSDINSCQTSLDPAIWSYLPEDLLDRTIAWLPLASFCRFRSVCKRWNSMVSTGCFLRLYNDIPTRESWILMFADPHYQFVFAYIPNQNKWLTLPLSFLPSDIYNVTVAGGLLCFRLVEANGSSSMCICNPVTRSWRKLPPMIGRYYGNLVGMVVEPDSIAYRIVVQTNHLMWDDRHLLRTEVYSSMTNDWRIAGVSRVSFTTGSVYCNGVLYFMTWEAPNGEFTCDGVSAYNVDQGMWKKVGAPTPFFYICPQLVECRGRLLMVGGFGEHNSITVGIRIWELQQSNMEWVVVETMPYQLSKHLLKRPGYLLFNCVGHGDLIYLSECKSPHLFVIFNCSQKSWHRLDTTPPPRYHATFSWFSFYPRLDAAL